MWDLEKIEFKNEKRFLSNMFVAPICFKFTEEQQKMFPNIIPDGNIYPSTEHIYQMFKSDNPEWKKIIKNTLEPTKTKTLARKYLQKDLLFETEEQFLLRSDWDLFKYELMYAIVTLKFDQHPELAKKLIALEGYIEERNCWNDTYWGTVDGEGENNLGKILMLVRDKLI
jgi:predicted NAD-dependent protein-ADP-ribosyltransferase YbiA (DUF1768 family)